MQSNVIFGFILVAYIFFITMRGELGTYLTILRGGGQQASQGSGSGSDPLSSMGGGMGGILGSVAPVAASALSSGG